MPPTIDAHNVVKFLLYRRIWCIIWSEFIKVMNRHFIPLQTFKSFPQDVFPIFLCGFYVVVAREVQDGGPTKCCCKVLILIYRAGGQQKTEFSHAVVSRRTRRELPAKSSQPENVWQIFLEGNSAVQILGRKNSALWRQDQYKVS